MISAPDCRCGQYDLCENGDESRAMKRYRREVEQMYQGKAWDALPPNWSVTKCSSGEVIVCFDDGHIKSRGKTLLMALRAAGIEVDLS